MPDLNSYTQSDLKQIYRILHSQLQTEPELMDSQLLHDLQTLLQKAAQEAGIDVSLHAQWAEWLNH